MDTPARILHVDRHRSARLNGAASLAEAIERLLVGDYRAVVLHAHSAEWDDYGLVAYLSGIWPELLHRIAIRSVKADGTRAFWNATAAQFEPETLPLTAVSRLDSERHVQ